MKRSSLLVERDLAQLGRHVKNWRKVVGLTAAELADRAGITRPTLRAIESGDGSVKSENLFSVLGVLNIAAPLVGAADPLATDLGRARADRMTVSRVRRSAPKW